MALAPDRGCACGQAVGRLTIRINPGASNALAQAVLLAISSASLQSEWGSPGQENRTMPSSPRIRFAVPKRAQTIGVGLIGLGTVGTGTLKVLAEHQREIQRRLGCDLRLKVICSRSIHKR